MQNFAAARISIEGVTCTGGFVGYNPVTMMDYYISCVSCMYFTWMGKRQKNGPTYWYSDNHKNTEKRSDRRVYQDINTWKSNWSALMGCVSFRTNMQCTCGHFAAAFKCWVWQKKKIKKIKSRLGSKAPRATSKVALKYWRNTLPICLKQLFVCVELGLPRSHNQLSNTSRQRFQNVYNMLQIFQ